MQHVKLCLMLSVLIIACNQVVSQEPLKNALYIYTCRKDSIKDCEDLLKNSCRIPISTTREESKDHGTVTITVECKQDEKDTTSAGGNNGDNGS